MKTNEIKVCVLRIEGTNCEEETAAAFASVGASPELVHLKQLIHQCPKEMRRNLEDYHMLALPGGFAAGDYVRAGAILAARMKSALAKELKAFVEKEKPIIGICNGFQVLVELGMLPAFEAAISKEPQAALYTNDSARFECIPTLLKNENSGKCAFTRNLPKGRVVMFPSAHGEGKLMFSSEHERDYLNAMEKNDQVVFRFVGPDGSYAGYPWTPNGAISSIAGICNPAGNVMGLMPHPERVVNRITHPDWTRSGLDPSGEGDGRVIFQSAVDHVLKKA